MTLFACVLKICRPPPRLIFRLLVTAASKRRPVAELTPTSRKILLAAFPSAASLEIARPPRLIWMVAVKSFAVLVSFSAEAPVLPWSVLI